MTSPNFSSLSRWVLMLVKLSYSGTTKMNLFKMLDFQRIHFSRKRPWKCATISLLNQIVEISLLSQIIRFQVNAPFRNFLIVITNLFGSLKSKGRWLFMNNKLSLKIFWFKALWKPHFENKRNFWINCVCTKAFRVMAYPQGDIGIHSIPKRTSTFIASIRRTFASWHAPVNIYIMTYPQGGIYVMTYIHEHLHLHHGIPTWAFASWHAH